MRRSRAKKLTMSQWRNNPIVKVFRQEGLSYVATKDWIDINWSPPEGEYPMDRIYSTCNSYLMALERFAGEVRKERRRNGIPSSSDYMVNVHGLTRAEYQYIKQRDNE